MQHPQLPEPGDFLPEVAEAAMVGRVGGCSVVHCNRSEAVPAPQNGPLKALLPHNNIEIPKQKTIIFLRIKKTRMWLYGTALWIETPSPGRELLIELRSQSVGVIACDCPRATVTTPIAGKRRSEFDLDGCALEHSIGPKAMS